MGAVDVDGDDVSNDAVAAWMAVERSGVEAGRRCGN